MMKLLIKILLFLPILVVVFATTWIVDPAHIKNDDSYETGVASILLSGKNVANLLNYKERKLQQKIILGLSKKPEVIVLGSSRSMPINSSFFPGQPFINNSVSGASIEDYFGLFDLYIKRGIKPKLVIIGLDPWVLNSNNDQKRWEDLNDEYLDMKSILGFTTSHELTIMPRLSRKVSAYKKYKEFFSPPYFTQSLTDFIQKGCADKKYWATDKIEGEEPIKMSDGSLVYGKKMREKTVSDINSEAKIFSMANPIYSLNKFNELDKPTMQLLDSFIGYLKKNDINVLIFLPPYHPTVYAAMKTNAAYKMVSESEKWYISLASKHKINLVGSFDPKVQNFSDSDFYDGMHPKTPVVQKILRGGRLAPPEIE